MFGDCCHFIFHPLVLPSSSVDACQMVFYHPIYNIVRESADLVGRGLCSLVCFTQCLVCHTAVRLDSHTMVCLVSNAVVCFISNTLVCLSSCTPYKFVGRGLVTAVGRGPVVCFHIILFFVRICPIVSIKDLIEVDSHCKGKKKTKKGLGYKLQKIANLLQNWLIDRYLQGIVRNVQVFHHVFLRYCDGVIPTTCLKILVKCDIS